jgi:hypothetical protein
MKKQSAKKTETLQQRKQRLLRAKLRSLFERLSELEKTVASLRGQTLTPSG